MASAASGPRLVAGSARPTALYCVRTMVTPIFFPALNDDYGSGLDFFETVVLLLRKWPFGRCLGVTDTVKCT